MQTTPVHVSTGAQRQRADWRHGSCKCAGAAAAASTAEESDATRTTRFMYSSKPMILPSIRRSVFSKSHTWMRVFCEAPAQTAHMGVSERSEEGEGVGSRNAHVLQEAENQILRATGGRRQRAHAHTSGSAQPLRAQRQRRGGFVVPPTSERTMGCVIIF
jgi:hypothetical protein